MVALLDRSRARLQVRVSIFEIFETRRIGTAEAFDTEEKVVQTELWGVQPRGVR